MIKIMVIQHAGEYKGFVISGHSGYVEEGADDIVCAAVSTLGVNTVNSLEVLAKLPMEVEQEDGYLSCQFQEKLNEKGKLLMESMILGMRSLCESYGKTYTQLSIEEV